MGHDGFELPSGITGFGIDSPEAEVEARRLLFVQWARAVSEALESPLVEIEPREPWPSFDTVRLVRHDRWLLHNRFVALVGVLAVTPEPGPSWAVAGEFVDIVIPRHATGWGPRPIPAGSLNAHVDAASLAGLPVAAQEQADRYKPTTVGHVMFNYWS